MWRLCEWSCLLQLGTSKADEETSAHSGPSGSGKSSIQALLTRFYDPDEGRVLFDGEGEFVRHDSRRPRCSRSFKMLHLTLQLRFRRYPRLHT